MHIQEIETIRVKSEKVRNFPHVIKDKESFTIMEGNQG